MVSIMGMFTFIPKRVVHFAFKHIFDAVGFPSLFYLHHILGLYPTGVRFTVEMVLFALVIALHIGLPRNSPFVAFIGRCVLCWPLLIPTVIIPPIHKLLLILAFKWSRASRGRWWVWPIILAASLALHVFVAPRAELWLLGDSSLDISLNTAAMGNGPPTPCPQFFLPKLDGEFLFNKSNERVPRGLYLGFEALQHIPKPALEADFCSAERALEIIAPAHMRSDNVSPEVKSVRRMVKCPIPNVDDASVPTTTKLLEDYVFPLKLLKDYVFPLKRHRDALALSIYTYGDIVRPIFDSWLSYQTIAYNTLALPYYSPFHNVFSTPCTSFSPLAPIISSTVALRCALLSRTAVHWVRRYHNSAFPQSSPLWTLRTSVLPTFADHIPTWRRDLNASLPRIVPTPTTLSRFLINTPTLRGLGITIHQAHNYNALLKGYLTARTPKSGSKYEFDQVLRCIEWLLQDPRLPESHWNEAIGLSRLQEERNKAEAVVLGGDRATLGEDIEKRNATDVVAAKRRGLAGFVERNGWPEWVERAEWVELVWGLGMAVVRDDWDGGYDTRD